jgi:Ser/Thr protein kinase RdoA (MazF antagonist)
MHRFEILSDEEKVERYERLARKALAAYGMPEASLRLVDEGRNVRFEVRLPQVEGRYALRICHPEQNRSALLRELLWLAALGKDTALSIPEPILTRSGEILRTVSVEGVPGTRPCLLQRWVEGTALDRRLSPGFMEKAGVFLARLHRQAETFQWPSEFAPPPPDPARSEGLLDEALFRRQGAEEATTLFRQAAPGIRQTLDALGAGREVAGAIHGNPRLRNLRVLHGEIGAVGFDRCRWSYYLVDVIAFLEDLEGRKEEEALRDAFLTGYGSEKPLPVGWQDQSGPLAVLATIEELQRTLSGADEVGKAPLSRSIAERIARLRGLCARA